MSKTKLVSLTSALLQFLIAGVYASAAEPSAADKLNHYCTAIRDSWKLLDGGFHYLSSGSYEVFITGSFENAPGQQPQLKAITLLAQPQVVSGQLSFTSQDDIYNVLVTTTDGGQADIFFDPRKITTATDELITTEQRGGLAEDEAVPFPFFSPEQTWKRWLEFPWPTHVTTKPPYTTRLVEQTDARMVYEVRNDWTTREGKAFFSIRRITFLPNKEFEWLPQRIQTMGMNAEILHDELMTWTVVSTKDGPIAVPVDYELIDFATDPITKQPVKNSRSSYSIDASTLKRKVDAGNQAAWTDLARAKARVDNK